MSLVRYWLVVVGAVIVLGATAVASLAQDGDRNTFIPLVSLADVTATASPTQSAETLTPTPTVPDAGDATPTQSPTQDPIATPSTLTPIPPATATPTPDGTGTEPGDGACTARDGDRRSSSRFGVQMYTDTRPESAYFDALVASDAGWVRLLAPWVQTEPQDTIPANYDWTRVDTELAAARYLDLDVIATIGFAPAWATSGINRPNGPIDSENLGDFVDFVKALVERYDGDGRDDAPCNPVINHWELYNEADRIGEVGYRGGWADDPAAYAEMLRLVYPEIKRANPNAQVLFTGIAYDWFEEAAGPFVKDFTAQVLAAGGGDYFDIMNFHAFPEFWRVRAQQPPGIIEKTEEIRDILAAYGVDKPLMITETGSGSGSNEQRAPEQARYVHQVLAQSLAAGVDVAIWFMLYDQGSYAYNNGLVTTDAREKTSMTAYRLAVEMFERSEYVRTLSLSERGRADLLAYEFRNEESGNRFYVAWLNPVETTEMTALRLSAERAQIRTTSTSYTLYDGSDGRDDGIITVNVGAEPVYVEIVAQARR